MEGLNDIGFPVYPFPFVCIDPNLKVSASQIFAGYEQIIAKVHAKGLKIGSARESDKARILSSFL